MINEFVQVGSDIWGISVGADVADCRGCRGSGPDIQDPTVKGSGRVIGKTKGGRVGVEEVNGIQVVGEDMEWRVLVVGRQRNE